MTVNADLLELIAREALKGVDGDPRWVNAIRRGKELILQNRCAPLDADTLLTFSDSGHAYTTTLDECRDETGDLCTAFRLNRPCKHRAAFHLLVRYHEREQRGRSAIRG